MRVPSCWLALRQEIGNQCRESADLRREAVDVAAEIEAAGPQQPSSAVLDDARNVEQHLALQARRHLGVERLDGGPQHRQLEHLADNAVALGDRCRRATDARPHVMDKAEPGAVDEIVGDDRREDLALQRMGGNLRRKALAQRRREIVAQIAGQLRRVR